MNKKEECKNWGKDLFFFAALIGITFFVLLRGNDPKAIFQTLEVVKLRYVFVAISCVGVFICCEAFNIRRVLSLLGEESNFLHCLKYAFAGFFFSAITPSASGGQPMQLYYMKKDSIRFSHSSLALFLELASFQFVTVVIAMIGFAAEHRLITAANPLLLLLIAVGVTLNLAILCGILLLVFSQKTAKKMAQFIIALLYKIKVKHAEKWGRGIEEELIKYEAGAEHIRKNPQAMCKVILTTIIQMSALYSVPYLVYKGFGLNEFSYFAIFCLQAVLYIAVSALPLPGAVGASEGGFLTLFAVLFPTELLNPAMLLSRGISFYLFLLISGAVVFNLHFHKQTTLSRAG